MKPRVYIETTIPSYLTAWPSRDLVRAAHQQIIRQWWEERRTDFDLVVSQYVIDECGAGDPKAAAARLAEIDRIPMLASSLEVSKLAFELYSALAFPSNAQTDAIHIALTAVHRVDFLLTWNCTHIANAEHRERIKSICEENGFRAPIIATPEELLKGPPHVG